MELDTVVASLNPTSGALVVLPGTLVPDSRGNAVNLRLICPKFCDGAHLRFQAQYQAECYLALISY